MKQFSLMFAILLSLLCAGCGAVVSSKRTRCTSCGAKLSTKSLFQIYQAQHRSCAYCGQVVSDKASYCLKCGAKLPEKS